MDLAFSTAGPTVLVQGTAVQVSPTNNVIPQAYRIRNLSSSAQYFTHGGASTVASITPSAGVPAANTIGMIGSSVEVFGNILPWMIASSSTGFEVTPGEGV
jgi:hypothetical protein